MIRQWNWLNDKFQALSVREKWLIAGGMAVSLVLLLQTLLIDPVMEAAKRKESQLTTEQQKIQRQQGEVEILKLRLQVDPDKEIDKKLSRLSERSLALSQQLAGIVDSLITPQQMTELLETVLRGSARLKLEALESLPAEAVLPSSPQQQGAEQPNSVGYYIHPVRIELTGSYFAIKEYLEKLESMPMQYYWRSFNYQVEAYPEARLILEVYTLGTRQEFIGG